MKTQTTNLIANTFGIVSQAQRIVEITSIEVLVDYIYNSGDCLPKTLILGAGSNVLLPSRYDGVVLHSAIKGIEVVDKGTAVHLRVGSGEVWDDFVEYAVGHGWSGAEALSLIPGTVGAAAVQNIGAYGSELSNIVRAVNAIDMRTAQAHVFYNEECQYSYRRSVFKTEEAKHYYITSVEFVLSTQAPAIPAYAALQQSLAQTGAECTANDIRQAVMEIRNSKLPDTEQYGSAGSYFMNPYLSREQYDALRITYPTMPAYPTDDTDLLKTSAAWLIEQAGWKGKVLGKAAVWSKQPLVLINNGGATQEDILALATAIQREVHSKFGIMLQQEVITVS